jgi:hypothetical protein
MTVAISVNLTILATPPRLAETVAEPSALTVPIAVNEPDVAPPAIGTEPGTLSAGLGDRHLQMPPVGAAGEMRTVQPTIPPELIWLLAQLGEFNNLGADSPCTVRMNVVITVLAKALGPRGNPSSRDFGRSFRIMNEVELIQIAALSVWNTICTNFQIGPETGYAES